jgi:two-component system OmpR family sensor kinase
LLSTRGRLVLLQVVILGVAAAIADVSIYQLTIVPAQSTFDGALYEQLHSVDAALVSDASGVHGTLPTNASDGSAIEATVVDKDGNVIDESTRQSLAAAPRVAIARRALAAQAGVTEDRTDRSGNPVRLYAEPVTIGAAPNDVTVAIVVSSSSAPLEDTKRRLLLTLLAGSLLLVVVGGGLAYVVIGRTLRPVREIAELARTISERDLHQRVGARAGADEIGELVRTFNLMLNRLEAAFESLHRFTADASHELRAPLAVIRSQVEVALNQPRNADEYQRVLRSVVKQVEHLTAIAEELLLIARADAGVLQATRTPIDVADFVHEVAARWQAVAESRHFTLAVDAPDAGVVGGDAPLLTRVLDNLLDNASRYAPELSTVTLAARQDGDEWVFEVSDQGPGVEPQQRARIFERFARADSARTRDGGGAGLGLALGAAIAAAHGGSLRLVDHAGPGATFQLRLPASSPG